MKVFLKVAPNLSRDVFVNYLKIYRTFSAMEALNLSTKLTTTVTLRVIFTQSSTITIKLSLKYKGNHKKILSGSQKGSKIYH